MDGLPLAWCAAVYNAAWSCRYYRHGPRRARAYAELRDATRNALETSEDPEQVFAVILDALSDRGPALREENGRQARQEGRYARDGAGLVRW